MYMFFSGRRTDGRGAQLFGREVNTSHSFIHSFIHSGRRTDGRGAQLFGREVRETRDDERRSSMCPNRTKGRNRPRRKRFGIGKRF